MKILLVLIAFTILPHPSALADEIKYLRHGNEALAAFVNVAAQAKSSIELATYIFEPCHASGQILLETLAQKAKAGVKVRILLDNFMQSSEQKEALENYFSRSGIQVAFYNESPVPNLGDNLRLHGKFLVADKTSLITGGRNISDEYFSLSSLQNWVDRDAYLIGRAATQASVSFNELWNSPMTTRHRGNGAAFRSWGDFCPALSQARIAQVREYLSVNSASLLEKIPVRSCASTKFLSDHPDFGNPIYGERGIYDDDLDTYMTPMRLEKKRTTKYLLAYIANARSRLVMENWMYLPMLYLGKAFSKARANGVAINIVTNADMESGPALFKEAEEFAIGLYSKNDSTGSEKVRTISSQGGMADRFALTPRRTPFLLHAKTSVRDHRDVVIGSFNLDPRSYNTNNEALLAVQNCPAFAADVEDGIQDLIRVDGEDARLHRVPPKPEPSFFAILFAYANMQLF
ncbi:MAG: phospholipase D-like domain-containing protein [Bdellovibrionota bacterium]